MHGDFAPSVLVLCELRGEKVPNVHSLSNGLLIFHFPPKYMYVWIYRKHSQECDGKMFLDLKSSTFSMSFLSSQSLALINESKKQWDSNSMKFTKKNVHKCSSNNLKQRKESISVVTKVLVDPFSSWEQLMKDWVGINYNGHKEM